MSTHSPCHSIRFLFVLICFSKVILLFACAIGNVSSMQSWLCIKLRCPEFVLDLKRPQVVCLVGYFWVSELNVN